MNIKRIAFLTIILLVMPVYQVMGLTSVAQQEGQDNFTVSIANNTVIAANPYYSIKLNLTWGGRIVDWNITSGNQKIDLIQSDTFYPSLNFITYTGETPTQNFTIRDGNNTVNATYPYPLMYLPWNAELVYNGSDEKIIELTPTSEAALQLGPLELKEYIVFYKDTPYIDVFYVLANPTTDEVPLSSNLAGYGIVVELSAYTGLEQTPKWNHTYRAFSPSNAGEVFNHTIKSQNIVMIDASKEKVFYLGAFQAEEGYISIVSPLYTEPSLLKFSRTFLLNTKLPIYALGYDVNSIPGDGNLTIGLRVLYSKSNPYWLSQLGADQLSAIIDNDTYSLYLKYRENFTAEIETLNNTIKGKDDYIKFLQERLQNVTSELNEVKENASYWKTEYNVIKQQVDEMLSRSKLDLAKTLAIAIVGLLIGFYGGRVFEKKNR